MDESLGLGCQTKAAAHCQTDMSAQCPIISQHKNNDDQAGEEQIELVMMGNPAEDCKTVEHAISMEHRLLELTSTPYNFWERPYSLLLDQASSRHLGLRKSDVLKYFAKAARVKVKSIGSDVQVTDLSGNPLFDGWYQVKCANRVWTLEAYGWPVLLVHDQLALCDQFYTEGAVSVVDSNGSFFGSIGSSEPCIIQDAKNCPIARLVRQNESAEKVLQGAGDNAGEPSCADSERPPLLRTDGQSSATVYLTCLNESDSACIASLDTMGVIEFDGTVNLHTKLMILIAIVRLVSLDSSSFNIGCSLLKTFIGCCFRGY